MGIFNRYKNPIIISIVTLLILTISYGFLNIGIGNDYSIFVSDFKHQYMEFYKFYRENLFNDFSKFIYNQGLGLGNEMFGLYNYYLASPLNLLLFLFPKSNIETGINLIIYIKLILGGIFFEKYLAKFNYSNILKIAVSLSYVFSGYFLFNLINPIWLDICYMLPITMIALDYMVKTGIKKWFIISASFMIIINFYIGFMLCLFSFIYLMYEYFQHKFNKTVFINYFISAFFIVTTSITTLYTSYLSMSMSKGFGGSGLFEDFFKQIITPLDFFSKFVIGSNGFSQIASGFPNVWLSSIIGVLFILMLFDSRVKNKTKIINISFLGFIYLIFSTNGLNKIFHGFSNPIWFLYRNSFIFIFLVLLIVSYYLNNNNLKEYKGINYSKYLILLSGVIYSILLMFSKITEPWQNILSVSGFWLMLILTYVVLIKGRKTLDILILFGVILGVTINSAITIMNPYKMFGITNKEAFSEYNREISDVENVLNSAGYSHNYRVLKNYEFTYQEGINFNFNEFKGFSSNFNKQTMDFLEHLGLDSAENNFKSITRNALIDNLFGNKYIVLTKEEKLAKEKNGSSMVDFNKYSFYDRYMYTYWEDILDFDKIGETKYSNIYENPYTLQTFYPSNAKYSISKEFTKDTINNQNILFKSLFNTDENIIEKQDIRMKESLENIDIDSKTNSFVMNSDSGSISYSFDSDRDYIGYLDNNIVRLNTSFSVPIQYSISLNDENYYVKETYVKSYNGTNVPVNIRKGKNVLKIEYKITNESKVLDKHRLFKYTPNIYDVNTKLVNEKFNNLKSENSIEVETNNSTKVSVKLSNNNKKVLRSTIPYDKNWKAYVSTDYGRKEIPVEELDSFIAVDIDGLKDGVIDFEYSIHNIKLIVLINTLSLIFVIFVLDRIKFKKD